MAAASLVVPAAGMGSVATAQPQPAPGGTQESSAQEGRDKFDPALVEALEESDEAAFWVRFTDRPDLNAFAAIEDWDARGQAVYDALTSTAEASQAQVRAELDAAGVEYETFWASNAIRVSSGTMGLASSLASSPEVEGLYPTRDIPPPELREGSEMAPDAISWGVEDVNAPEVWARGFDGEGIIVATIDSGVQWDHPALQNQYRGYDAADGSVDHDYNWFDWAGTAPAPTDGHGHGTHVTGTIVGGDGADNQIGVAPGATWIAANGCCPNDGALVASGEWMLAPRDLDGDNPRPDLRPHVINNSWGTTTPSNDPFMEDVFDAWNAAGQFGVFANGNAGGYGCRSSSAPGSLQSTYSVGNYRIDGRIEASSGKGTGQNGEIKPNIAAPGTDIRSSLPGGQYGNATGTSMASPHVAGAVALLWSAAPDLIGDFEGTRQILDETATDVEDLQCGGTAADNNAFGEGKLDTLQLIEQAPIGATGRLEGTLTDASTGDPIRGGTVTVEGPSDRVVTTNAAGDFSLRLPVGDYTVTADAFGFETTTVNAAIEEDATTVQDLTLTPSEFVPVTGTVTDGSGYGFPLYAEVTADGTGVATFTDPVTGDYELQLPVGSTYSLTVEAEYPGYTTPSPEVQVDEATELDIAVHVQGYPCTAPGYGAGAGGCAPLGEGGYVVGVVHDSAGEGLVGATVTNLDAPEQTAVTRETPQDPAIEDGFYWIFSDTPGTHPFQAEESRHAPLSRDVQVTHGSTVRADYSLAAGQISIEPSAVEHTQPVDATRSTEVTVTNTGDAEATVELSLGRGSFQPADQPDPVRIEAPTTTAANPAAAGERPRSAQARPEAVTQEWEALPDHPTAALDNGVAEVDGTWYTFGGFTGQAPFADVYALEEGGTEWSPRAPMPTGKNAMSVAAVQGKIVVTQGWVPGGTSASTHIYDPATDTWATGADAPGAAAAAGVAVVDDIMYVVGGCPEEFCLPYSDGVYAYDITTDTWETRAAYPRTIAFPACGAIDGQLVCSGGADGTPRGISSTFSYHPGTNTWSELPNAPVSHWATSYASADDQLVITSGVQNQLITNATFAWNGEEWITGLPNGAEAVYRAGATCGMAKVGGSTGWYDAISTAEVLPTLPCGGGSIDWAEVDPTSFTVPAGGSTTVTVTTDSTGRETGTYSAQLRVITNTPQAIDPLPVTMHVTDGEDPGPPGEIDVERWSGSDRYETAAAISAQREAGVPVVFIATGLDYPDALTGSALAGSLDGPVLLTKRGSLPLSTQRELARLAPERVVVLGGPTAVSDAVVAEAGAVAGVDAERLSGGDRYGTAAVVAAEFGQGEEVFVATGADYPDALTAAARAGALDSPVLLVREDRIPAPTAQALDAIDPSRITVLGGGSVISGEVLTQLEAWAPATRVSGEDRYQTAARMFDAVAGAETIYLASGQDWPDALAGSARAGSDTEPLLLTRHAELPGVIAEAIVRLDPERVVVLGGANVIDEAVVTRIKGLRGTQ